jgi:hypothetical protein
MRRLLIAVTIAFLVGGLFPMSALASVPEAQAQQASTNEDIDLVVALEAIDASGGTVTTFSPQQPGHGSLSETSAIDCDGQTPNTCTQDWTYSPDENFNGSDGFTFTATSDGAGSPPAAVAITVDPVNDDPSFTVGSDVQVDEDSGPYTNSSFITDGKPGPADESDQTLAYTVVADTTSLFAVQPGISPGGTLTFTPATDGHGTTDVSVKLVDSAGEGGAIQHFSITIKSVNDAPTFTKGADVLAAAAGDTTVSGWATEIDAGGDESDSLTFVLTPVDDSLFSAGPAIDAASGDLTFTPSGTTGSTSVQVRLDDDGTPLASSQVRSFTITITDKPAAHPKSVTVTEDSANNHITPSGFDPEGQALTFDIASQPGHGTVSEVGGDFLYTPTANYFGGDSFTYTATDGTDTSPAATVSITVTNVNDPVVAKADAVGVKATTTTTLNVFQANGGGADSAGPGESLSDLRITGIPTRPSKGSVAVSSDKTRITYDPTTCATGSDSFFYTLSDGEFSASAKVTVMINRPGQNGVSTSPLTDAPDTKFVTNSTMGTTVPLRVTWCGVTTSSTSVRSHRVQQSTNSGSTYPTTLFSATTGKSTTRNVSINQDYRWRVRTVDTAGRTGTYRSSLVSIVRRYQDNSSRIAYSSGWGSSSAGSPSGGTEKFTKTAGKTATITVSNVRAFAIVGPRSSTRGSFKVYVDGSLIATVSEQASSTVYRKVLYTRTLTGGSHTLRIESVSSARVDIDAILTLAAQ